MTRAIAIAFAGLFVSAATGQERNVLTAHDVARIRGVTAAKISPDGRQIAYLLAVPRAPGKDDDGPAWSELHVVDREGHGRPFITGQVSVGGIEWTPDGKGISFLAKRGDDKEKCLYVIATDGGEARRVVEHKAEVGEYSWSPAGDRVAFLSEAKEDESVKKRKDKGFKQEIYEEDWRPTKVWIAAAEMNAAATGDADKPEPKSFDLDGSASELHWSPDGAHLTVALAPTSLIDDFYMRRKLHVIDAETGSVLATVNNPGKLGVVDWSPDGKHLAVQAAADLHDPAEGRLTVVPLSGGELTDLIPNYEGHVMALGWQTNDTLMYVGQEGCQAVFGKVQIDGSQLKTIVPAGGPILESVSLSKDGLAAAFIADASNHPGEVFYMAHGDTAPRRLTNSNPWLDGKQLAKQEVLRYKARDGLEIEGILIHPLDEEAGNRYPLILSVHGGPEAHEPDGWRTNYSRPGQVAAAEGYFVLYPNYRGSTGRGVAFSKLDQADYGGAEFNDLVDGAKHLIDAGLVDAKKVGVTGGSYGGYATGWCATALTEHFAAGVMFVGISDHVAKAGTTDIPHEMNLVHGRRWPWDGHWDWFRERSPIYHAKQARTPLLIMHGKDDPRVHPSQSLELYRYLKVIGETPVRLVLYPGEGHGNRKAAARLDYNLRMMQWFNHYLKGPGGDPPPYDLDYGPEVFKDDDATDKKAEDEVEPVKP
ncbi:MAG: S9 family peptidase [Phycisphaerales bacterium]|nr:S9 family peptidase [Phycisphaerales bacterium]